MRIYCGHFGFFAAIVCAFLLSESQSYAQYSISTKIPISEVVSPETTGGLGRFRLDLQSASTLETTYTPDTGPWPPDFSHPVGALGSNGFFAGSAGLLSFLDFVGAYSDRVEYGLRGQILGGSQQSLEPGIRLSVLALVQPSNTASDSKSNTCLLGPPLCYSEGRSWSVTTSSERFAVMAGYRLNASFLFWGQYYYQRYRSGGQFDKYDNSIPATYSRSLGGSGDVRNISLAGSFELPLGKTRTSVQIFASRLSVTSDLVGSQGSTVVGLGLGVWFDARTSPPPE